MQRIFSICLLFFLLQFVSATNYYVSTYGDNLNTGTSTASSWKEIQFALDNAAPGDTIFILEGIYYEKTEWSVPGESGNYITLMNYADDSVIIDGTDVGNGQALMYLENMNYIRIEGLRFTNHNGNYQPVINCYGANSHIEIRNCEFYNTMCNDSYTILMEGSGDDFIIDNNYLHDIEGDNAVGILFVGSDILIPFSNIIIRNNTLENIDPAPSEGIAVNGNVDGFEISNNYLSNINNIGIVMIGGEDWVNTNDAVNFARNGICKWNTVKHANSIYGGGYAAGVYVDGGKNIIVENNTVTGSDVGLEIGCENAGFITENITVRNNVLYKNEKAGLGFGGYDYPSTGNVINCSFTGNTVFDNDSLLTGFGQLWIQHAENCVVKNNIFYAKKSATVLNAYDWNISELGNLLDYNLYYSVSDAEFYFDGDLISGIDNYKTISGQDEHSLFADPEFVNEDEFDFHINMFSLAVNAGDTTYSPAIDEVDMDWEERISGYYIDIGADEYPIEPTEIFSIDTKVINFYPNPVIDILSIEKPDDSPATITVKTMAGASMFQRDINEKTTQLDLSALPPSVYLLTVLKSDSKEFIRVIKL
ncbi:MAG: T9SS type A sorting domain-containing protein [Fimbriimonadaceae bacterium]|nr:T9SS type A sorting domain-containing protein [Chitinophagales bacterium]